MSGETKAPINTKSKKGVARAHPPLANIRPLSAGEHVELALLRSLDEVLPQCFELFHSADWTQAQATGDSHGELDIVVVNSAGDIAILEVKSGPLNISAKAVTKRYRGEDKDVAAQVHWQLSGIQHRLRSQGLNGRIMHFLVLPDQLVGDQSTVGHPRERIADADDCQDLPGFIERKLGSGRPDELKERVCAFLHNRLILKTDVATLSRRLQGLVTQISGGLADWVPRIHAPSGVIRVVGTAGSGKTQLALALLRQARVKGQSAAYVCYNRPLADHIAEIAPNGVDVSTFHQQCWIAAGRPTGLPNFAELAAAYLTQLEQTDPELDMLIIDEVQDLQFDWVQALLSRVKEPGLVYLLDDPEQGPYADRDEIGITDAVIIKSRENYRSPRMVVEVINALRLCAEPIAAKSPLLGVIPTIASYKSDAEGSLVRATTAAVQRCLDQGHALDDISVISWRGLERSALMNLDQLGDWPVRRFSGQYDVAGQPLWRDGDLLIDTLRRMKGQSAAAVVLTEIDFEAMGPMQRNMLFVGMTRARMWLELVVSERAEAAIVARLKE